MLQDDLVRQAVSRILQRSERQEDVQKLIGTYVDVGVLTQLENQNHQVFYGRRGTGKTHVLKVLSARLSQTERNTVVYIDARVLGSTEQFSDTRIPLPQRCLSLFRDILLELYNKLLEHIVYVPVSPPERAQEALDAANRLAATVVDPQRQYRESGVTTETSVADETGHVLAVKASTSGGAGAELSSKDKQESRRKVTRS